MPFNTRPTQIQSRQQMLCCRTAFGTTLHQREKGMGVYYQKAKVNIAGRLLTMQGTAYTKKKRDLAVPWYGMAMALGWTEEPL